jgi:hypothetical protein
VLKSKTAAHGSWTVLPPSTITPSEKGVFFCMKDPSIAAAGSEGTVTYHVVVPNSNEEGDNSTTDAKRTVVNKPTISYPCDFKII